MAERYMASGSSVATETVTLDQIDSSNVARGSNVSRARFVRLMSTKSNPLESVKIIDLTRIVAGPYCSMILADLGAQVYKIEQPLSGDECRNWPPNIPHNTMSCYFASLNRNKKSICVNLKSSQGRQVVRDMATTCDVLIENFVPGKLDSLGLGYEELKILAPQLIYCSITGYGSKGPYKTRPGYDVIAASVGGLIHITGPKDGDPCKPGVALTDLATGLYAHGAILAALLHRTQTQNGQKIEVNLLSTQLSCLINIGSNFLNAGLEGSRWGTAHESIVPYESFKTKDGYITVGAGSNAQFKSLCTKLGMPELAIDPRFSSNPLRVSNRHLLIPILKQMFLKKTSLEWMSEFEGGTFPCGPVNSMTEEVRTVTVTLRKPKDKKQVSWTSETVDNENMNKKKSKCCCIYKKPREFGESSSDESDGECENCFGHVEVKKKQPAPTENDPPPIPQT